MTEGPLHTLVVGMTRSGKTTLTLKYLLNCQAACRFLFDDNSRFTRSRPWLKPVYTEAQWEAALPSRWIAFNPLRQFPDDYAAGFAWFCRKAYECSRRGPGLKVVVVDELWQWADARNIPRELRLCTQAGAEFGIQLLTATQEPHRVNSSIVGQTRELICFRLQEPKAWQCISELGADAARVAQLPLGSFIAWDRLTGGTAKGENWEWA